MSDDQPVPTTHATTADSATALAPYMPVALAPRHNGWTADRQRTFLTVLAETGSISHACTDAGISARSAYRLRVRPEATTFAAAWEAALKLATVRLTTLAFERATRGTVREYWKGGHLIGESRAPSDKLLVFLLQHLGPGHASDDRCRAFEATIAQARDAFPRALDALTDSDVPLVPIESRDYFSPPPGENGAPDAAPGDADEDW